MPTKAAAGGTFVGDATNLLIPIGLLAAREGIQWYKGSKSAKAIVPAAKKPSAAKGKAKAKPKPKPKKRSVRGGDDDNEKITCGLSSETQGLNDHSQGGANKKKSKSKAKASSDPNKVIKMARAAIKSHVAKKGGASAIVSSFVNMAEAIGKGV